MRFSTSRTLLFHRYRAVSINDDSIFGLSHRVCPSNNRIEKKEEEEERKANIRNSLSSKTRREETSGRKRTESRELRERRGHERIEW